MWGWDGGGWGGVGWWRGGRCDPACVETRKACHASRGLSRVSGPLWGFSAVQHDRSFSRAIVILPSISSRFSRQPPLRLRVSIYFLFVPPPPPPPPSQSIHQAGDDPRLSPPSRLLHIRSTPTASLSPSARPFFFLSPSPERSLVFLSTETTTPVGVCARVKVFFFPPWYSFLSVHLPSASSSVPLPANRMCRSCGVPPASFLPGTSMSALIIREPPASAAAVIWPRRGFWSKCGNASFVRLQYNGRVTHGGGRQALTWSAAMTRVCRHSCARTAGKAADPPVAKSNTAGFL